jgi:HSP20 family protein
MVHIRNPWQFQDLFEELDRMTRDFSRVFDPASCLAAGPETGLRLEEGAAVLEIDLPGVGEQDLQIALDGNRLRIAAKRDDGRVENEDVVLRERSYGEFTREYSLPWTVSENDIQARFRHGVLTVRLPKRQAQEAEAPLRNVA